MMLTAFAIALVIMLAISIGVVEYTDRARAKLNQQKLDALRRHIEHAKQKHQPRKELRKQYVEAVRQEIANG